MSSRINTILSLVSQLVTVSKRSKIAGKLATELGVDDFSIFVRDKALSTLLPAPGFQQPSRDNAEWIAFLKNCHKSGRYIATLTHLTHGAPVTVTAVVYKNELAVVLIGDNPSEEKLSDLEQLLPLLASLFHYEQFADQANFYIQQTEASAKEHQNIAQKLDAARKSLQSALAEKDTEIHERIKSEAALAESEQRFRFMAESLSTMIFTSHPSGALDYVSPQWANYTGLALEDIKEKGLVTALHVDDAKAVLAYWDHSYQTGDPIEQEIRFKKHDGTYRWHLLRAEAMRNEHGEVTMWVGSSTDIEDVKANMQKKLELEEKTELLTRQQKDLLELNAAKDEFIRLASHQLRTPATGVKMYIGMLMGGYADEPTEKQMQMLDQAYKSNDRQLQIIDDLLKVATVDAGKVLLNKEACDLASVVGEVISELQHTTASRKQQIIFIPPPEAITAHIDKRFIRMVVENIIDNASKYSPANTTITVNVARKDHNEITIIDQGVGIAKKDQAQLFKKFSRVHNSMSISAAGTGLGLYWAKEIISLHGGTITINSKLRHGSTFTIKLPL
jgi:PAS domain S-box-containing protein